MDLVFKCLNCDDLSECIFCSFVVVIVFVLTRGIFVVVHTDTIFFFLVSPNTTLFYVCCVCAIILAFI